MKCDEIQDLKVGEIFSVQETLRQQQQGGNTVDCEWVGGAMAFALFKYADVPHSTV